MKYVVVDANNLAHRVRHVIELSHQGHDTSVFYGVINSLHALYRKFGPDCTLIMCWDYGIPAFRYELVPEYKNRSHDIDPRWEGVKKQMNELHDILRYFGIVSIKVKGVEADDLIGVVCVELTNNLPTIVVSNDRDMYQLVDEKLRVYDPINKKFVDEKNFPFDLYPSEWSLFRALTGDSSDKIPGIAGVGTKTAANLLIAYQDVDGIVEAAQAVVDGEKRQFINKRVAANIVEAAKTDKINKTIRVINITEDNTGSKPVMLEQINAQLGSSYFGNKKKALRWLMEWNMVNLSTNQSLLDMPTELANNAKEYLVV